MRLATRLLPLLIVVMVLAVDLSTTTPRPPTADDPTLGGTQSTRLVLPWLAGGHPSGQERYVAMDAALDVAGGFAYLASDGRLLVVDVRDPSHPRLGAEVMTEDQWADAWDAASVVVSGGYAYVLDRRVNGLIDDGLPDTRLLTFDITAPTAPRLVSWLDIQEWAFTMAVVDGWLYVSVAGWDGLESEPRLGVATIDLSDPGHPRRHGFTELGFFAYSSAVTGDRMVLAGAYDVWEAPPAGVMVLDLSQPGAPRRVGAASGERGLGWSVAVVGGTAVRAGYDGADAFDLASPDMRLLPIDLGLPIDLEPLGNCSSMPRVTADPRHFMMFATCGDRGVLRVLAERREAGRLLGVDVVGSLPMDWRRVPSTHTETYHMTYTVHGADDGLVYLMQPVADPGASALLTIIDISTPTTPRIVGRLP